MKFDLQSTVTSLTINSSLAAGLSYGITQVTNWMGKSVTLNPIHMAAFCALSGISEKISQYAMEKITGHEKASSIRETGCKQLLRNTITFGVSLALGMPYRSLLAALAITNLSIMFQQVIFNRN